MLCKSYNSKILYEEFHWIYLRGDIKLLLVTVTNRLILEIEIVHDLSCHHIHANIHMQNADHVKYQKPHNIVIKIWLLRIIYKGCSQIYGNINQQLCTWMLYYTNTWLQDCWYESKRLTPLKRSGAILHCKLLLNCLLKLKITVKCELLDTWSPVA